MKKYKKPLVLIVVLLVIVVGFGISWLNCPEAQFNRHCKEEFCPFVKNRLNKEEKKSYIAIRKYMEKNGKKTLDNEVLKVVTKEELSEIGLKTRAALADLARQSVLDNMAPRDKFQGNYDCMRQAYINELSNEEVLFLQSLKGADLKALQNPVVRQMYLNTTPKIMRCMNEAVQKKYLEEVKMLTTPPEAPKEAQKPAAKKKKAVKKEEPKEEKKD